MSSVLKDKSFGLALKIVQLYRFLAEEKKEYVLSKQMLRSGTSIGANVREAQNAESQPDFIHKLSIAQKECDETLYWLELLITSEYLNNTEHEVIYTETAEILKMLKSAIITTKQNIQKRY